MNVTLSLEINEQIIHILLIGILAFTPPCLNIYLERLYE